MKIQIAEKLRPFTHTPGTKCLLPGSSLCVEIYPVMIRIEDLEGNTPVQEIALPLKGPVNDFTVQLDLEKGVVWLWGTYLEGYRRYRLWAELGQFKMAEKRNEFVAIDAPSERLSLGSHKKQDWDLVKRRRDLTEIFPHWLRLGQWVEKRESSLLPRCLAAIEQKDKEQVHSLFLNVFESGFKGLLAPQLKGAEYLGLESFGDAYSPIELLSQGARLIRRLFVHQGEKLSILPCLPPEFHAGRFTGIHLGNCETLDLEWSKKTIRRMIFRSRLKQTLRPSFQKGLKNYRIRKNNKDKGSILSVEDEIPMEEGIDYFFDRFQR